MDIYRNISTIAALIGDTTRTSILASLADGRSLTAGELAYITKVSPQTASAHLAKLVEGGLLTVQAQGRHRYYRLANEQVAEVMEAIAALAPPAPVRSLRESDQAKRLRFARTCYEHIAGEVGVVFTNSLVRKGYMEEFDDKYQLTRSGEKWLDEFGVKIPRLDQLGRSIPRHIDWTERRHHLGGPIAAAITKRMLELGWIARGTIRRSIQVTEQGQASFKKEFDMSVNLL